MPYLLFMKKQRNLKLSSAANYRWRFIGLKIVEFIVETALVVVYFCSYKINTSLLFDFCWLLSQRHLHCSIYLLTLKAPRKKCIWKCRLLKSSAANSCLTLQTKYRSKQRGPRTDCSYRSSLIWVHTVCHRDFLNISADEKSRRLLLRLGH